jgi:hypothetical protein
MDGVYLDIWYEFDETHSSDIYRSAVFPDKAALKQVCRTHPIQLVCAVIKNSDNNLTNAFKKMPDSEIKELYKKGQSKDLQKIVDLITRWVEREFIDDLSLNPSIGGAFNNTPVYDF